MKLLLDTTYLLPAIGLSVKGIPADAPLKLIDKGNQIHISDISVFELSAKGGKYITTGALQTERVTRGIRAIAYDEKIFKIALHDELVLRMAFMLRSTLTDFIDCLVVSSAISYCEALVTEDSDIQILMENRKFEELLETTNPRFQITSIRELLKT